MTRSVLTAGLLSIAALGLGIAWFVALFRVISAIVVVGGLAAFMLWLRRREAGSDPTSPLP